jgi:hypothetical protein
MSTGDWETCDPVRHYIMPSFFCECFESSLRTHSCKDTSSAVSGCLFTAEVATSPNYWASPLFPVCRLNMWWMGAHSNMAMTLAPFMFLSNLPILSFRRNSKGSDLGSRISGVLAFQTQLCVTFTITGRRPQYFRKKKEAIPVTGEAIPVTGLGGL